MKIFYQELMNSGKFQHENGGIPIDSGLTADVIQAAISVHKALGPGFLESFYEEALSLELTAMQIPFERQKAVPVRYRGKIIGEHRLDLLVAHTLVVELKTVQSLEPIHFSVVRSYMKALGVDSGILLNFAAMPLTIKRVAREYRSSEISSS
ncbi:MAG: GxxExxY protein [Kiritimatiellia bacterium]